jgi:hypothetical protein
MSPRRERQARSDGSGIDEPLASDQRAQPPTPALVAPAETKRRPAALPSYSRWPLLNPFTARHSSGLTLGVVGFRRLEGKRENLGYSLAFSEGLTTVRGGFLAGGRLEHELRLVPKDALSLNLARYYWEAGPRIGALEPMARVGVTLLHLDYGQRFSFGMFSPRVGLGVWFKLPQSRVGLSAFTEYFWRWVGEPSAFVHGITLEIQPDALPLVRPRPTSSPAPRAQP